MIKNVTVLIKKKLKNVLKKRYGSSKTRKGCESGFPFCFLTDFTKFFLEGSTLLDFGFLTEKASWIYRIFII